jgi:hypothetical protein
LLVQVGEYLFDDHWVFDAGDDFHRPAAVVTGFDVDVEDMLQALRPAHGRVSRGGRPVRFLGCLGNCSLRGSSSCIHAVVVRAPAALARCYLRTQVAVRCKHAVITREVHARRGHQGGQAGDEVQGLEEDVGGAVAVRGLELVSDVSAGVSRMSCAGRSITWS